ncbi:hypothetical protein ACB092_01G329300 [Castanea dentata]
MGYATCFYNILLHPYNGSPFGFFRPQRGVRQGDPLSPFLFVLAGEVLARLIEREALCNGINGFKLARDLNPITHLQFLVERHSSHLWPLPFHLIKLHP